MPGKPDDLLIGCDGRTLAEEALMGHCSHEISHQRLLLSSFEALIGGDDG